MGLWTNVDNITKCAKTKNGNFKYLGNIVEVESSGVLLRHQQVDGSIRVAGSSAFKGLDRPVRWSSLFFVRTFLNAINHLINMSCRVT